jgi:hypothetical protein
MKIHHLRLSALCALLLAGTAQAEYLCAEPPTRVDRRACEAAREGPDALRQFIQRMNWQHHNLDYHDYVNAATQLAWDQQRAGPHAHRARATVGVKTAASAEPAPSRN